MQLGDVLGISALRVALYDVCCRLVPGSIFETLSRSKYTIRSIYGVISNNCHRPRQDGKLQDELISAPDLHVSSASGRARSGMIRTSYGA